MASKRNSKDYGKVAVILGVSSAERKMRFINLVKDEQENRILVADIIKELFTLTPANITFRSVEMNSKGFLTLQGYARESTGVNKFQGSLVSSAFFRDVNLQYATKRKRFKKEYTEFKINCRLAKSGQAEL